MYLNCFMNRWIKIIKIEIDSNNFILFLRHGILILIDNYFY